MKFKIDVADALGGLRKVKGLGKAVEDKVAQKAADYFKSITPIRTGNARSHTYFDQPNKIIADYPYAERLDEGYSKQAPQGMSAPTERYVAKLVGQVAQQELKKLGK